MRDPTSVPVLMFHSIGPDRPGWVFSHIAERRGDFAAILSGLRNAGFETITLADLYEHMAGTRPVARHSIVLTFDDGYLDNWLEAVPLLREFGMRATVYVTPEFVEDSERVRSVSDLDSDAYVAGGFMSWGELRAAEAEGVLDVQSHALTHTWYFSGPRCVDVHRPRRPDPYPWLAWNRRPDRKPYYMGEDQQSLVPWGTPVLEHEKALIVRRYEPDPGAVTEITDWVAAQGGAVFFDRPDWRAALTRQFNTLVGDGGLPGRYETGDEHRARVLHELRESKAMIESRLDKRVRFLAWPGGGVDPQAEALAEAAGYDSWTLASRQQPEKRNRPGTDPRRIKRVSGSSSVSWQGRLVAAGEPWWVVNRVLGHQGAISSRVLAGLRKRTRVWLPRHGRRRRWIGRP